MHRALTFIGLGAAVVLILASATMNYLFAVSLGRSAIEGRVLGVVSVAVDILKALLAVFVASAAIDGRRVFVVIGSLAFLLFTCASVVAAAGFASANRGEVFSGREQMNDRLVAAESEVAEMRARRKTLPSHRPASVVEEALNAARQDRRWQVSKECTASSNGTMREFCEGYFRLRGELAAAREATRLDDAIKQQLASMEQLRGNGAGTIADPQARLFARALGIEEGSVQRLLMALIALVVEVASGLGIYLATGHTRDTKGGKQPGTETAAPKPLDPHIVIEAQPTDRDRMRRRGNGREVATTDIASTREMRKGS